MIGEIPNELIQDWNCAGPLVHQNMLYWIFRNLETAQDMEWHNFVITQYVLKRVGNRKNELIQEVAEAIRHCSERNLQDGQTEKEKT